MAKRPSLAESMKSVQHAPAVAPRALADDRPARQEGEGRGYFAATRQGMKRVTVPVSAEEHRRLKRLSADTGRTVEDLGREAFADLFAKLG